MNKIVCFLQRNITNDYLFYFFTIDILFLPYFPLVSITLSTPFVMLWCLINLKNVLKTVNKKVTLIWSVFLFFALIGTVVSFFVYPSVLGNTSIWSDNIKRFLQFVITACYYMFYYFYFCKSNKTVHIKKILMYFVFFMTALAIIFLINKNVFHFIKFYWNPYDSFIYMYENNQLDFYRYNFIWTDPNNHAYMLSVIYLFLNYNIGLNIKEKIMLIVCTIISLIASMSIGGIAIFALCVFGELLYKFFTSAKISSSIKKGTVVGALSIGTIGLLLQDKIFNIFNNLFINIPLIKDFWLRITNYTGISRIDIWLNFLCNKGILPYLIFGTGYTTIINGAYGSTHNGNLLIIYAYGMIAFLCFLYLFFYPFKDKKIQNNLYIIPFFVGFTMNIMIGEQKLLFLYIFIHLYSRIRGEELKYGNKYNSTDI